MSDLPAPEFSMEEHRRGGTVVIRLTGELDLASADGLAARLQALRAAHEPVVLDLDELEFMDSSGLRVVLQFAEAGREGDWRFALTAGSEPVRRLFASAGVADRLPIEPVP